MITKAGITHQLEGFKIITSHLAGDVVMQVIPLHGKPAAHQLLVSIAWAAIVAGLFPVLPPVTFQFRQIADGVDQAYCFFK